VGKDNTIEVHADDVLEPSEAADSEFLPAKADPGGPGTDIPPALTQAGVEYDVIDVAGLAALGCAKPILALLLPSASHRNRLASSSRKVCIWVAYGTGRGPPLRELAVMIA